MWLIRRPYTRGDSSWLRALVAVGCVLLAASARALPETPPAIPDTPPPSSILDPTNGVGAWIWDDVTADKQTCRFWKSFEIPHSTVAKAWLRITVDNGYRLFLDGREIGRGSDWRTLNDYDLTWLIHPGRHILAVEAFNDRLEAGLILGMRIELVDQRVIEIASDGSWFSVPDTENSSWVNKRQPGSAWHPAKVIAQVGTPPWAAWPFARLPIPALLPVALHFWQQGWFQILLLAMSGIAILISLQLTTRLAVQARAQKLLQLERARIARDIHDDLGARLTQLVLLGEVARGELPSGSQSQAQIVEICEKARDLSHAMDEVVWAVNSRRDTVRDFASYVCKYAQLFLASSSVRCRLDVEPEIPADMFDLPIRRNLFLAVKEALNNAAKHSHARELFLRIHRQGDELAVAVEDNGRGFNPAETNWERNGMANMAQRMSEVGGRCQVTSAPGQGCRVDFAVPLVRRSRVPGWLAWKRKPAADPVGAVEAPGVVPAPEPHSTQS
jgi:signal transduction histidine kinase